jgi:thiol-disulfide isomerase/thioredoxin
MTKILSFYLLVVHTLVFSQHSYSIQGHFPHFPNSKYELKGFSGFQQITLSTSESKDDGKFVLNYPSEYCGVAHLYMNGAYQNLFLLNKENINVFWKDLNNKDGLQIQGCKEYDTFLKGMKTFQEAEAKVAGLNYLLPLYSNDSIKQHKFAEELNFTSNSFPSYIKSVPEHLFARQYLLTKGLIEQMPRSLETYTWRAPSHVIEFMAIDFKALKHSGLFKDVIHGYTNLVERFPQEEVYPLLNDAINKVLTELKDETTIQQEIAHYWFTLLERKSLFSSAEYLALKMLNQNNCVLDEKSATMYEQYRSLAVGKTAPDIILDKNVSLKKMKSKYKLVVFGASWCPTCKTETLQLVELNEVCKKNGIEIVYISIDTDQRAFEEEYKSVPWLTYCNFEGWETKSAKDYYVFSTPTYFVLDRNLKIILRPNSATHFKTWIEQKLKQEKEK